MKLKGTITEQNLLKAFAGESQARNRYTFFAQTAKEEGYEQIAGIFAETADQELAHARRFFDFLDDGGMLLINAEYPAGRPAWMSKYVEMPIANPMDFGPDVRPFPAGRVPGGGNMAFRRAGLVGYGGFDPSLGRVNGELIGGEENDFFERLLQGGETIWYVPGAVMWHIIPPAKLTGAYFRRLSYNVGVSQRLRAEIHRRRPSCWRSPNGRRRSCSAARCRPANRGGCCACVWKSAGGCLRKLKIRSCRLWSHAISPSRGRDLGWGRIVNTAERRKNAGRQRILRKKIGCDSGMRCCFKYKGLNICSALCI